MNGTVISNNEFPHQQLLLRVAGRVMQTSSATDLLMLTRWRVLAICQFLLGEPDESLADICRKALEAFANDGITSATEASLGAACVAMRSAIGNLPSVLPSISIEKRQAVSQHLKRIQAEGSSIIEHAFSRLPGVQARICTKEYMQCVPGIPYRLKLVASILGNTDYCIDDRSWAAAAILYVDELQDVIPDDLGIVGILDDDYALRLVLETLEYDKAGMHLHWSEKIAALWDDMPFLQGVDLVRGMNPCTVTWLDRINSYIAYSHVLGLEDKVLIMLQPSVACSPLHVLISLAGLLALETTTSPTSQTYALRVGQVYEIDGFVVRFNGFTGPPTPGWLRLEVRDGIVTRPPELAKRMIRATGRRLSALRERGNTKDQDPLQRFLGTDFPINATSISKRIVLVASHRRAHELFDKVQSNGVHLLDHSLVRFITSVSENIQIDGSLILVVPTLGVVRGLLKAGVDLQAVLIDGYNRLLSGRHQLPFLLNIDNSPSIMCWSASGYYPTTPQSWLPMHRCLEVSKGDLIDILELDSTETGHLSLEQTSLQNAATGHDIQLKVSELTSDEQAIVSALDSYMEEIRLSTLLPEYWKYQLFRFATTIRLLVTSTPSKWFDIRRLASEWSRVTDEKWLSLRSAAAASLSNIRTAEGLVLERLQQPKEADNSRARTLRAFVSNIKKKEQWFLVCDRIEQIHTVSSLIQSPPLNKIKAVLLRDLVPSSNCIVAGWVGTSFARRLFSHTPHSIVVMVDSHESKRWSSSAKIIPGNTGHSVLESIGISRVVKGLSNAKDFPVDVIDNDEDFSLDLDSGDNTPCTFIWLMGEMDVKILPPDGKVLMEQGNVVHERKASDLCPGDRVVLGLSASQWAPTDEFTDAIVHAMKQANPKLVLMAREWRRALLQMQEAEKLSSVHVQARLASIGVKREISTIEGWLDIERTAPIAPRGLHGDLNAIWPLIQSYSQFSIEDVISACSALRGLHAAAANALLTIWKGMKVDLGIDEKLLHELVDRVRQGVHVYQVETVTKGNVPTAMLGWWVPASMASQCESEMLSPQHLPA